MKGLALRVLRLFVDSVWLATAAAGVVGATKVAARAGLSPRAVGALMLTGLVGALAGSVGEATRRHEGRRRQKSLRSHGRMAHDED